jgi:hypothetical protein
VTRSPPLVPTLLATLLLACGGGDAQEPAFSWEPVPPLPAIAPLQMRPPADDVLLLDGLLAEARFEGRVASLLESPPEPRRTTLLDARFDDGLGPFSPWFGQGREEAATEVETVALVDGALRLAGPAPHGVSARSDRVPVRAGRSYVLRYRVRAVGTPRKVDGNVATATLIGFRQGRRWGDVEASFRPMPEADGWTLVEARFAVPDWSDELQVSLDLGRPGDDRSEYAAAGVAWFDDVTLVEEEGPVFALFAGEGHPLLGRAPQQRRTGFGAIDLRDALWGPAPSTISWSVRLPEAPLLRTGLGLLPDVGGGDGAILFSIEIEPEQGPVQQVLEREVPARARRWYDEEVDLSEWAGQTVVVRLVTEPLGLALQDTAAAPSVAAAWSSPKVVSAARDGRRAVVVVIDTLSANRTSPWGHPAPTTPSIARIAQEGTRYARAWSPSPWTLPAFASLLTGLGPGAHGAGALDKSAPAGRAPLAAQHVTLTERLSAAGWSTAAWINNPFLVAGFGADQGFARHIDAGTRSAPGASETSIEDAVAWLTAPGSDDRFALVHLMEPHGPYRPTDAAGERFAEGLQAGWLADGLSHEEFVAVATGRREVDEAERAELARLHDAVVADADAATGRLFDALRSGVDPDDLLFAVLSDHGEELWEHGRYEHGHSAYQELVAVPLVVVPGEGAGVVVERAVSTASLGATVLAFADLEPGGPGLAEPAPLLGGRSLYGPDRWYARVGDHKLVVEVDDARVGRRSFVREGGAALFDLSADPDERSDLLVGPGPIPPEAAAAVREGWRALLPDLLASLDGHHVIAWAPGADRASSLSGRLEAEGGVPGPRRRLAWPDPEGRPGVVRLRSLDGGTVLRFELPAEGGVLAIPVGFGPLRSPLRLVLDDPPEGVAAEQLLDEGGTVDPAAFFAEPAVEAPRLLVGRASDVVDSRSVDPSVLEQLRSLGYVE